MSDGRARALVAGALISMLAVGIVLGSGPLRSALVGSTGSEIERLQGELAGREASAEADLEQLMIAWDYIDAAAPTLLAGRLAGADVLVVRAPGAAGGVEEGLETRIVQASGVAAGTVSTEDGWTDADSAPFRDALAAQVAPSLVGVDATDAETLLAHAFVQAATGAAPRGTDLAEIEAAGADRGAVLWQLLAEAGLVSGEPGTGIDGVVIVAAGFDGTEALVDAFAAYDAAVVVVGPAGAVAPFEGRDSIATVVDGEFSTWNVSTVAALAEAWYGAPAHYGYGELPEILGVSVSPDGAGG